MKRGKKLIWLLLAVAVLVGAMLLIPRLTAEEEPEAEADTSIELLSVDVDAVESLSWTHEGETLSFRADGARWICENDPDFPTLKSTITTMLEAFAPLNANSEMTDVSDLSIYGLQEPSVTVTFTVAGQTTTVCIGDENAMGGLRYVSVGDGKVYLVTTSLYSRFNKGMFDVMVKDSLPTFSAVSAVRITADGEETWPEVTSELTYALSSLKWTDYASYDAEDLEPYGLDEPIVVEVHYTGTDGTEGTMILEFGDETGEEIYVRLAESSLVYLASTETVNTILGK